MQLSSDEAKDVSEKNIANLKIAVSSMAQAWDKQQDRILNRMSSFDGKGVTALTRSETQVSRPRSLTLYDSIQCTAQEVRTYSSSTIILFCETLNTVRVHGVWISSPLRTDTHTFIFLVCPAHGADDHGRLWSLWRRPRWRRR